MPPAALISLTASLTPLSKFVPDVAPVPDSSTNPTIRTGACCARDGSAAVIIQMATEEQKTLFMNSSIQQQVYLDAWRATAPPRSRSSALVRRSATYHVTARDEEIG